MTSPSYGDGHEEDLVPVKLPSGATFALFEREQNYVNTRVERYLSDLKFTSVGDLADLDRVIILELFAWRWSTWLSQQQDYWREPINEKELASQLKDVDGQIKAIKATLGIDKVTRDKSSGVGSISSYLENLRLRAEQFGIKRNEESSMAITLFKELEAKITLWKNCTESERAELHANLDDIVRWLEDEAFPKYNEIDRKFRQDGPSAQKIWIHET